jgi:sulfide:quinone oxidoreductase
MAGVSDRIPRVVICGGGIAGVEALIALRTLAGDRAELHLIAPNRRFVYQPLAVAEPFGEAETHRFDLAAIAHDMHAELHADSLIAVDAGLHAIRLAGGSRMHYDALVVAVGPRRREWLPGALSFGGAESVEAFSSLLGRLVEGSTSRVAFAYPEAMAWPLPLYELALMTASHLADEGVIGAGLTLVTPESEPLEIFGPGASRLMRDLLLNRRIDLRTGAGAERIEHGSLRCRPNIAIDVDEVVALAALYGPAVTGLPADEDGFIEVGENNHVVGLDDVYAAGDGTSFPVKQGGLATQQADAAAQAIAASLGAPVAPSPTRPTLRAVLLNGIAPLYLRARLDGDEADSLEIAGNPLWMPPAKVAGLYLAPYLGSKGPLTRNETLQDRPLSTEDPATVRRAHDEAHELALTLADRDAAAGDFDSALQWLDALERIDGVLPPGYLRKRAAWARGTRTED